MKDYDRARCERLMLTSRKSGSAALSDDDVGFMHKMWVNHPVEYKTLQRAVVDRTTAELNSLFSGDSNA
jgi:hypothetical protein